MTDLIKIIPYGKDIVKNFAIQLRPLEVSDISVNQWSLDTLQLVIDSASEIAPRSWYSSVNQATFDIPVSVSITNGPNKEKRLDAAVAEKIGVAKSKLHGAKLSELTPAIIDKALKQANSTLAAVINSYNSSAIEYVERIVENSSEYVTGHQALKDIIALREEEYLTARNALRDAKRALHKVAKAEVIEHFKQKEFASAIDFDKLEKVQEREQIFF